MGFNLSNKIQNLNDAMFPGPNKANANLISAFGGESLGFARGALEGPASGQFYTTSSKASADTVAMGNNLL